MKKTILSFGIILVFNTEIFSQTYDSSVDYFGNTTTIIKDKDGNYNGSIESSTDYFRDVNSVIKDEYNNIKGTAKTTTDYFGNTETIINEF